MPITMLAVQLWAFCAPVRAENVVHGFDQQGCPPGRPAVMITDHVPAVRLPPHPPQRMLPIPELAAGTAIYGYSFILTNLDVATPDRAAAAEHWYLRRPNTQMPDHDAVATLTGRSDGWLAGCC